MLTTYSDLAAALRREPLAAPGRSRIIAVDGRSGAGKTTFARRLSLALAAPCIEVDDFVPGWEGLAESIRLMVDDILRPLCEGRDAGWRRYDWLAGAPDGWVTFPWTDLVVIEGCGTAASVTRPYLQRLIWIDTPEPERLQRLRDRDDWPTYAPYFEVWAAQEAAIRDDTEVKARADVIVDGGDAATPLDPEGVFASTRP